jgi:hypothetical protein
MAQVGRSGSVVIAVVVVVVVRVRLSGQAKEQANQASSRRCGPQAASIAFEGAGIAILSVHRLLLIAVVMLQRS